jgi:glycerol-3-phosphate O-acyltransferase/dihydroxyacetone phosphate acyltransferase
VAGPRIRALSRMTISAVITRVVGRAASVFQSIERSGERVPDGPVLVVANHPNSLLDPLVIFRVAGRPTRPLAKAPLFDQLIVGTMLRLLGGLPVYRAQDNAAQMHLNEETFRGAIAALRAGDAVQIYPEGKSHSEPSLVPMRTGAARIALGAEQQSDWTLGLRIVPIGLTYERKSLFRGRVLAVIDDAFTITHLRSQYERDPVATVRQLTDDIAEHLHRVTLNVAEHRDAELIDTAERLYVREKGVSGFRERDPLAERLPRLRAFARGLAWLREHDPAHHQRLARAVAHYRRRTELLGVREGDVPPGYGFGGTLRYILANGMLLLALLPLALVGTVLWYPTYLAPHATLRLVRPEYEAIATYKFATGCVTVPITIALAAIVGALIAGWKGALLATVLAPLTGIAAIAWHRRWQQVREDTQLFFRVLFLTDRRERLARDRATLAAEFDALVDAARVFTTDD